MVIRPFVVLPFALLAACGPPPVRVTVPELPADDRVSVGVTSVELLEVELPAYADGDEIFVQDGVGLRRAGGVVWGDDPSRAVTLELARALGAIADVPVAPEPWPYDGDANVRLDVRVAEFAPDVGRSAFVLRGLYFVAALGEAGGPNRAREFALTVPLPDTDPATIAVARAQAVILLAREIAADGLQ
jgi:uncharacterized lipoprotein YmbA